MYYVNKQASSFIEFLTGIYIYGHAKLPQMIVQYGSAISKFNYVYYLSRAVLSKFEANKFRRSSILGIVQIRGCDDIVVWNEIRMMKYNLKTGKEYDNYTYFTHLAYKVASVCTTEVDQGLQCLVSYL